MTLRQLAQILLSAEDLDKEVKIAYRESGGMDITSIKFDGNILTIGASGYSEDKLKVRTEIEVKSPYSETPQIF